MQGNQTKGKRCAMDLISRQAAIKNAHLPVIDDAGYEVVRVDDILALPSAQRWIPCSERLPQNERKTYWVCTDVGSQHECRWTNNRYGLCESDTWGWSVFDIPQFTEVVAWMPLPESYKGGDTNE